MRWEQWSRKGLLLSVLALIIPFLLWSSQYSGSTWTLAITHRSDKRHGVSHRCHHAPGLVGHLQHCYRSGQRYLSYQPPGNGWNNQRAVFETALVISRLLNRTLIVQPITSHEVVMAEKKRYPRHIAGYRAYNKLASDRLLPLSRLLDVETINRHQYSSVLEWRLSHEKFLSLVKRLGWRRKDVCHSAGFGYWLDRLPSRSPHSLVAEIRSDSSLDYSSSFYEQNSILALKDQAFEPNSDWTNKCDRERQWFEKLQKLKHGTSQYPVLVRALFNEFQDAGEDLIYFEEGTLFAMDVRFLRKEKAREAQSWILGIHYHQFLRNLARKAKQRLHNLQRAWQEYDAIHIRRGDHPIRHVPAEYWLRLMAANRLSRDKLVFTASDESNRTWFNDIIAEGYSLVFLEDLIDIRKEFGRLGFPEFFHQDAASMIEQLICESARKFVGSEHSTLSSYIMRKRGELPVDDGLLVSGTRILWFGHTTKSRYYYHGIHLPGITDLT